MIYWTNTCELTIKNISSHERYPTNHVKFMINNFDKLHLYTFTMYLFHFLLQIG